MRLNLKNMRTVKKDGKILNMCIKKSTKNILNNYTEIEKRGSYRKSQVIHLNLFGALQKKPTGLVFIFQHS